MPHNESLQSQGKGWTDGCEDVPVPEGSFPSFRNKLTGGSQWWHELLSWGLVCKPLLYCSLKKQKISGDGAETKV